MTEAASPKDDNKKNLMDLILDTDRERANQLLDSLASQSSYQDVIFSYLEPVLFDIGDLWVEEEISLAQGYVAGKIAEDILEKALLSEKIEVEKQGHAGVAVVGNIEDDYHALGRKMVVTFLRMSGWEVHDLGNDVLAKEFVDKAIEVNASVIGASAMMYSTAENIKKLRHEIDSRGLTDKLQLAVGGAVFRLRPELVAEVGGDGTANSAINAPKMFNELQQKMTNKDRNHEQHGKNHGSTARC